MNEQINKQTNKQMKKQTNKLSQFLEGIFPYFDIFKGFWKKSYHVLNTAAHTPKMGLQTTFTASSLGHTRLKLEMNVPQKTHQVVMSL